MVVCRCWSLVSCGPLWSNEVRLTHSSYLKKIILKNNFPHFGTWKLDSGPFQPVPGRKFEVESEFGVKISGFLPKFEIWTQNFEKSSQIIFLDKLPRNSMGKILKKDLREMYS